MIHIACFVILAKSPISQ